MDKIVIEGGHRLQGEVLVSGAKNAALPLIAASLLTGEEILLENVPRLMDVRTILNLLRRMGVRVGSPDRHCLSLRADQLTSWEAPYELVKTMRASVLVLGPLLGRYGRARISLPGGCSIGSRPINLHLMGLEKMGARIELKEGYVEAECGRLQGAQMILDTPTVTGTENLMMAASLAEGLTVLENAAREPEVSDLAELLVSMGARIEGAGSGRIAIEGVKELKGARHRIIPDRIEAGTWMVAAAITGGNVLIREANPEHMQIFMEKLREAGTAIDMEANGIRARMEGRPKPVNVKTLPYPGFPTDMQAQMMALVSLAQGRSVITETVFENRFMHVNELTRMGASIRVQGNTAIIQGVSHLSGAPVMATDLRASACLVLAGLAAQGTTSISRVYHLDRGYEGIERKLSSLGAAVQRLRE
ncbi:MAG: UDP-N-acetylglucosamine 1-carboxyvinyltransferase [candidate division NC10 bacterium]|nr:UDP-N-acetylglucosamine 1-carboxyvinyltransferase [candidate division NC10 bacterium]